MARGGENPARAPKAAAKLGAGIVSGAADNDPTTIATLAVIGATTVYGLAWLVILIVPMLAVVQAVAARIGAVSKHGLEYCIRAHYGRGWGLATLVAVLSVNLITLAADLGGGGAALQLLTGVSYRWWLLPLAIAAGALLVVARYETVESVLKYTALVFIAYAGATILAHPNWLDVLRGSFVPHIERTPEYVSAIVALLGTTLTSYAYVWETIETSAKRVPLRRLGLFQADAVFGISFAGFVFWCILIATGATLGVHHRHVDTADEAAQALAPIAGRYASLVFGIGLLGSAAIAVPVLAGTSAYVIAEMFGWRRNLDAGFRREPRFYGTLLASLTVGVAIAFAGVPPIRLLYWSGIAGGIATPFTLGFMMLVARNSRIMGKHRIGTALWIVGWAVTGVVLVAALAFLYQTAAGAL